MVGEWVFEPLGGASVRRNPNEAELFRTEQADEGEYAGTDALVREVLQNSLDAKAGEGPVHVRIALHAPDDGPRPERLDEYFGRLRRPLEARGVELNAAGMPRNHGGFLVCEDFGTRGLGGEPLRTTNPPPGDRSCNDFFWFWRNIGHSGKTGADLGRWGLGKTVYRAASRAGCMLGLTVRHSDGLGLLMGQAVLKIHEHDGTEYQPEGFWCAGCNLANVPMPLDDAVTLRRFAEEWRLTRRDEPGLSVVVPFVAAEVKASRILQAVAVHFFARIIRGELSVAVSGPGFEEVTLDAERLEHACGLVVWDGPKRTKRHVAPPIPFAKAALMASHPVHVTNVIPAAGQPSLDGAFAPQTLNTLRQSFLAGEPMAIRVRIGLQTRAGEDRIGEVDVHLRRHADGHRRDSYYVREGMTITKENSSAAQRGVQALVNVDAGPLAFLLGDAEGPAHESWDTSEERPDRTWRNWKGRVRFVRKIVDHLVELLNPPSDEPDFDLLSDFFSIEKAQLSTRPRPAAGDKPERAERLGGLVAPTRWYRLNERKGGFDVKASGDLAVPIGSVLRVSVAYDLPSGNPLKNWNKFDFDVRSKSSAIKATVLNVDAKATEGNIVDVTIKAAEFKFGLDGFDLNRDLFIRIDEIAATADAEAAVTSKGDA